MAKSEKVRVRVLTQPFRDREAKMVKRRPRDIFFTSKERAEKLVKEGWVELYNPAEQSPGRRKRKTLEGRTTKENKEATQSAKK